MGIVRCMRVCFLFAGKKVILAGQMVEHDPAYREMEEGGYERNSL